jgi:6,7-dimethyl-8-ribityllumazine synthase
VDLVWVPGCFEIGVTCRHLAGTGRYAAVVALGAVIRGSTSHYDHVAGAVAAGVAAAGTETGVPVIFGVLTTDTIEQAVERAGTKHGNNGWKAGLSAIEMASLFKTLAGAASAPRRGAASEPRAPRSRAAK